MKRLLLGLGCFILFILPLYIRIQISASGLLRSAREARADKRVDEAIDYYRKAASWRAPFTTAADEALFEMRDYINAITDPKLKLEGFRELRSAVFSSRSFLNYTSTAEHKDLKIKELVKEAEQEIEKLAAVEGKAPQNIRIIGEHKENFNFQILAQFAFWAWIAAVFYFIFGAFDEAGKLKGKRGVLKFIPIVVCYTLWIFALLYA